MQPTFSRGLPLSELPICVKAYLVCPYFLRGFLCHLIRVSFDSCVPSLHLTHPPTNPVFHPFPSSAIPLPRLLNHRRPSAIPPPRLRICSPDSPLAMPSEASGEGRGRTPVRRLVGNNLVRRINAFPPRGW